ncbi:MAG: HDOD domain-containing protein [Desulfobacteraceae bacterium]|nr:HDOD domain-containing protein [Desulfobacteraceae bacterium]
MAKIAVAELVPGMIVKYDIEDRNGRVLLNQGAVIESHHLRILKMWGVYEVDITSNEAVTLKQGENAGENSNYDSAAEQVNSRFSRSNTSHPCVSQLYKIALSKAMESSLSNLNDIIPDFSQHEDYDLSSGSNEFLTLEDLINEDDKLPVLPDIFSKLMEVLENPRSNALDIAKIIEKDQSLCAATLKLVNSSFYGFSKKIDNIYNSVVILGTKQLGMLALGLSVVKIFNEVESQYLNIKKMWQHSLGVGICSKIIARMADCQDYNKIFVAGMIHDIGKLVILKKIPLKTALIIKEVWEKDLFVLEAEEKYLGFTHCQAGEKFCTKFKMPDIFADIARNHHNPQNSQFPLQCSVVHLAEVIVNAVEIGSSGEKLVLPLNEYCWEILSLSSNAIPVIVKQLQVEMQTSLEFLS